MSRKPFEPLYDFNFPNDDPMCAEVANAAIAQDKTEYEALLADYAANSEYQEKIADERDQLRAENEKLRSRRCGNCGETMVSGRDVTLLDQIDALKSQLAEAVGVIALVTEWYATPAPGSRGAAVRSEKDRLLGEMVSKARAFLAKVRGEK